MPKLLFMSSFPFQYENQPQKRRNPGETEKSVGYWKYERVSQQSAQQHKQKNTHI